MSEQTKNKIFWWVFALSILASVVFTYIRVFINLDYMLVKELACDLASEQCFIHSPEELCEGSDDPDCLQITEPELYKIIHKKAANVQECNVESLPEGEECPDLSCAEGEPEEECFYEVNN